MRACVRVCVCVSGEGDSEKEDKYINHRTINKQSVYLPKKKNVLSSHLNEATLLLLPSIHGANTIPLLSALTSPGVNTLQPFFFDPNFW